METLFDTKNVDVPTDLLPGMVCIDAGRTNLTMRSLPEAPVWSDLLWGETLISCIIEYVRLIQRAAATFTLTGVQGIEYCSHVRQAGPRIPIGMFGFCVYLP